MGNKSILMSIKPEWVCKILNGEKTIEIRKKFPKDYVGWVYLYCTKGKPYLYDFRKLCAEFRTEKVKQKYFDNLILNGKVVARFWCDKVEEIECVSVGDSDYGSLFADTEYQTETLSEKELTQKSCLIPDEIFEYFDEDFDKIGYAIHISKLDVFEKPKELKEFRPYQWGLYCAWTNCNCLFHTKEECENCQETHIQKAPQSWCYVED